MNTGLLVLLLILPGLLWTIFYRRRTNAAVQNIIFSEKGRIGEMKELAKRFIGKEIEVTTFGREADVSGNLLEVSETGLLVDALYSSFSKERHTIAINLNYVTQIKEKKSKKGI